VKDSPPPKTFSPGERLKLAAMCRWNVAVLRTKQKGVGFALTTLVVSERWWLRVNSPSPASRNSKRSGSLRTTTQP
jgi:hypothetical protein